MRLRSHGVGRGFRHRCRLTDDSADGNGPGRERRGLVFGRRAIETRLRVHGVSNRARAADREVDADGVSSS